MRGGEACHGSRLYQVRGWEVCHGNAAHFNLNPALTARLPPPPPPPHTSGPSGGSSRFCPDLRGRLESLCASLARVEQFYDCLGGMLGYQVKSLQLIVAGMGEQLKPQVQQRQRQGREGTVL